MNKQKALLSDIMLPSGTLLKGRYIIEKPLGYGGFCITYLAWDKTLTIKTVVKEYMPKDLLERKEGTTDIVLKFSGYEQAFNEGVSDFLREARILARFTHSFGIAGVIDYFSENNTAYIVMPYCKGETLTEYVNGRGGTISYRDCIGLLQPVMKVLAEVHGAGIIHRDISPENILITDTGRAVLLDFGASEAMAITKGLSVQSAPTATKRGYAPPEQYSFGGLQGPWTDVYAMAATIYHCVTGRLPASAVERMHRDDTEHIRKLCSKVPRGAGDAVMKALSLESGGRYQSFEAFMNALSAPRVFPRPTAIIRIAAAAAIFAAGVFGGKMFFDEPSVKAALLPANTDAAETAPSAGTSIAVNTPQPPAAAEPPEAAAMLKLSENDVIPFADARLEEAVREITGKAEGNITVRDVKEIRTVDVSGRNIESLDGLQYFPNLCRVSATNNMIGDLSPLAFLERLEHLSAGGNLIEDISCLKNCGMLSELDLCKNYITDISVLGGLINLVWLNLEGNNISDVSPIAGLPKLNWLNIAGNSANDISCLAQCPRIESIAANENEITDISAFEGHPTLQNLQY